MLPDGAIFCGECGRSVTVSANRRPVPAAPLDETPPPPLRQPDQHGRHPDPATEAWLPEATLDPATRAWLTGEDRQPAPRADDRPAAPPAPAPTQGVAPDAEPPLDPAAYPVADETRPADGTVAQTHAAQTPGSGAIAADTTEADADRAGADDRAAAPVWAPAAPQPPAPSRPSWWVGRGSAAPEPPVAEEPRDDDGPQPGDTAVVEPLVERRTPTPLVTPSSGPATCPVCGHTLEPDDIFCAECGAVRPTVTAAFTGPVVPLPLARPDWAAEHLPVDDAGSESRSEPADGSSEHVDESSEVADASSELDHADTSDEAPPSDPPSDDLPEPRTDAPGPDTSASDAPGQAAPEDTPRTPLRTRGAHAAPDAVPGAPVTVPPAPASPTVPTASVSVPPLDGVPPVPTAAPLPPVPGATGPVLPAVASAAVPSSADDGSDAEDVEETRIVDRNTSAAPFVLHFSTGERTAVQGTGLLGRLPRPQPGERFDELLTVHDPGKSVSKTHLELGRDGDDLWVADRFSGNGTVVRHIDGTIRRCEPGRRYRVERGARVDIGEQFFLVQ